MDNPCIITVAITGSTHEAFEAGASLVPLGRRPASAAEARRILSR